MTKLLNQVLIGGLGLALLLSSCTKEEPDGIDYENNYSIVSLLNLPEVCTDCESSENCAAQCEEGLEGLTVMQLSIVGIMPPIPCEPPPPGLYYPNFQRALNVPELNGIPPGLYPIEGKAGEVNVEEEAAQPIRALAGENLIAIGSFAICWPPPPPPPIGSELSSLYLEVPGMVGANTLGLVYVGDELFATAEARNAVYDPEADLSRIPFFGHEENLDKLEGTYTIIARYEQVNVNNEKILSEFRFTNQK